MKELKLTKATEKRDKIIQSQKKQIEGLYEEWYYDMMDKADALGDKADWSGNYSDEVNYRKAKSLKKQMEKAGKNVSNDVYSTIKENMYLVSEATVKDSEELLSDLGFIIPKDGPSIALSNVPDKIVRKLATGQVYEGGWNLSKRIWSNNEGTMKYAYELVAKGIAENTPIQNIAEDLADLVDPKARKPWNPVIAMKNTKTGEIEYKRIYRRKVDYNAQRLARTLAQHTYQQTLIEMTEGNPFVQYYIWRANGSRPCEVCQSRDGKKYMKGELPLDHPNGMCIMIPVTDDNIEDEIAEWYNSPTGTYPEIDEFAKKFGYDSPKNSLENFVLKYGYSDKSLAAWHNSMSKEQLDWAKELKDDSGLTWQQFYEKYLYTGEGSSKNKKDTLLDKAAKKVYKGIWKDEDVTIADYSSKKGSIIKKKEYYQSIIDKYSDDYYKDVDWVVKKLEDAKEKLKELKEFEKYGKAYQKQMQKTNKIIVNSVDKSKALRFTNLEEADKFYRDYLDSIWDNLTEEQKYSIWEYTRNSNPENKSLSGYHDGWSRYNFLGLGNTDLGHEDSWRHLSSSEFIQKFGKNGSDNVDYKNAVKNLTTAIEKSELQSDAWFVRGSNEKGLAGLFEGDLFTFDDALAIIQSGDEALMKSSFEGQVFTNHAFTSTGIAKGTGLSGEVSYDIFAKAGSKGIYAEPASYFGGTISGEHLYETGMKKSYVGTEAEVIFQRGSAYRVDSISYSKGGVKVEMELVEQPDYFKTGLEHTHNKGKTSYKK